MVTGVKDGGEEEVWTPHQESGMHGMAHSQLLHCTPGSTCHPPDEAVIDCRVLSISEGMRAEGLAFAFAFLEERNHVDPIPQ